MSKKDETLRSVLDSDEKMSQLGTIVIALIVGFITLGIDGVLHRWQLLPYLSFSDILAVFLFVWRRGRVSRRGICLVGLCESGKTLIFTQLVYKKALESFTSMKENVGTLEIENKVRMIWKGNTNVQINANIKFQKGALKIVDVPGHERVRQRFFDNYKNTARGIVFVLDSFTLTKDIRDVAE